MPIHQINEVKAKAKEELHEEDFKHAVSKEKLRMRAANGKFRKQLVFQWPFKLVERFPVYNRRHTDKGRTI